MTRSVLVHQSNPILPLLIKFLLLFCPLVGMAASAPPTDQVMTQFVLPPYHGPRSPLDLVAIKIIFGCIFEAF
jgi:hypothetical protein